MLLMLEPGIQVDVGVACGGLGRALTGRDRRKLWRKVQQWEALQMRRAFVRHRRGPRGNGRGGLAEDGMAQCASPRTVDRVADEDCVLPDGPGERVAGTASHAGSGEAEEHVSHAAPHGKAGGMAGRAGSATGISSPGDANGHAAEGVDRTASVLVEAPHALMSAREGAHVGHIAPHGGAGGMAERAEEHAALPLPQNAASRTGEVPGRTASGSVAPLRALRSARGAGVVTPRAESSRSRAGHGHCGYREVGTGSQHKGEQTRAIAGQGDHAEAGTGCAARRCTAEVGVGGGGSGEREREERGGVTGQVTDPGNEGAGADARCGTALLSMHSFLSTAAASVMRGRWGTCICSWLATPVKNCGHHRFHYSTACFPVNPGDTEGAHIVVKRKGETWQSDGTRGKVKLQSDGCSAQFARQYGRRTWEN